MDKLQGMLREKGLKITAPRLQVLELLMKKEWRHSSAERIQQALKAKNVSIALATIYRVLAQFEEVGLVYKHTFNSQNAIYELHSTEHHDHMICVDCGKILEFCDETIEKRQHIISEKMGFKMINHDMAIYGMCRECTN